VPTQAVEVTGVVVVGAAVHVPVGVDGVGRGHGVASMVAILLKLKRMVEVMVAMKCIVSILFTDLASGLVAATATALATMTKATTGGRCVARVSRLVTGSVGWGLDVTDRVVALDAHPALIRWVKELFKLIGSSHVVMEATKDSYSALRPANM
jgi:hypothetical protein